MKGMKSERGGRAEANRAGGKRCTPDSRSVKETKEKKLVERLVDSFF